MWGISILTVMVPLSTIARTLLYLQAITACAAASLMSGAPRVMRRNAEEEAARLETRHRSKLPPKVFILNAIRTYQIRFAVH